MPLLKMLLKCTVIAVVAFSALLFFVQHQLIWFPRSYPANYTDMLPDRTVRLEYETGEGKQLAFYLPPANANGAKPERIWVVFSGNGSVALDWLGFIGEHPTQTDGFLLIDYPGYGRCQGSAEPACIAQSSDAALAELAKHLGTDAAGLEPKVNVLAHSIGCGAALEFATRHPARKMILISPFTSLRDMAWRTVGPFCWVLRHNFDNRARLSEIAASKNPPRVFIFHGADDTFIPPTMGRELAGMHPEITTFQEVPEADHNSVVKAASNDVFAAMNR